MTPPNDKPNQPEIDPTDIAELYAPPQSIDDGSGHAAVDGLSVEGHLVVSPKGHEWPDRCVFCNAPANGYRLKRKLYWHHPLFYLFFLLNWFVYLIIAVIVRRSGTVTHGLCPRHRARRRNGFLVGWIGFAGALGLFVLGFRLEGDVTLPVVIAGILGMLGSLTAGLVMVQTVRPKRIDRERLWLITGGPFRNSLSQSPKA